MEDPANQLNQRLRDERAASANREGEPGGVGYAAQRLSAGVVKNHRQRLSSGWALNETPTVADLPVIGRLSGVPVIGRVLSFGREVYGLLWLLTHRRSPFEQQIRFNRSAADALSLLDIELQVDRELQVLKKDVGLLDARTGVEYRQLETRVNDLAEQVRRLAQQVRELREAVERPNSHTGD